MSNESARAREVHRFYQPWLETFHATSAPATIVKNIHIPRDDGHIPQSSKDRALTAFAQLGALRLNCRRGVVTLIDSKTQYVLAEATRTLSLMDDQRHDPGDELWLGNSRIPRGQGMSEDALNAPEHTARGPQDEKYTAAALVVPDMAVSRYKDKKYAGAGISFYAGVPIVTSRGHTIGVYNITDNKSRDGLTADELRFMTDMSRLVVQHLDTIRGERARVRGERLIQGIGTFIEGDAIDANLSLESPGPNLVPDPLDAAGRQTVSRPPFKSRQSSSSFKGLTITDSNAMARQQHSLTDDERKDLSSIRRIMPPVQKEPVEDSDNPYKAKQKPKSQHAQVFDRAARILRKCLGADGVAFVDASSANLSRGTARQDSKQSQNTVVQHSLKKRVRADTVNTSKPPSAATHEDDPPEDDPPEGTLTPSAAAEGLPENVPEQRQLCEIIALITRDPNSDQTLEVAEHELRKLIRRQPQGKCYTFDEDGMLAGSDDSASEGPVHPNGRQHDNEQGLSTLRRKDLKRSALVAALPKARTIVFLPLWDFANQRWNAAAVMWSSDPAKMMNVYQDFSYLKAFANSVTNEITRLNLLVSDAAKSTFLANISHELRSPLHGILGSIEFLHDTTLDDFQSSMVIAVETCGKTLLDTVNHVLDFAKLNNLAKKQTKNKHVGYADNGLQRPSTSVFDLAAVVEEAVEAVYAGQVFRAANQDALAGQGPSLSSSDKYMATRRHHKQQIAEGQAINSSSVRLTLNVDDSSNYCVTAHPGAIRRIVMNLLGNSLKYTEKGSINVSLEIDSSRNHDDEAGFLHACITVTDTGIGMTDDFVRNHAFTAFSQEDTLAAGTGLGLSIIRSIVDSLGGKIDLRSQKGLGTEIKVWLSLPSADDPDAKGTEKSLLRQMIEQTADSSLCILKPPMHKNDEEKNFSQATHTALKDMPTVEQSLRHLLDEWFRMKVYTVQNMDGIEKADFFVYAEPPSIEYLLNEHGQHSAEGEIPVIILCENAFQASSLRASGVHHLTEIGRIIEVVAQPVGPQKLARVLQRCSQRTKLLRTSESLLSHHVTVSVPLLSNDPTQSQKSTDGNIKPDPTPPNTFREGSGPTYNNSANDPDHATFLGNDVGFNSTGADRAGLPPQQQPPPRIDPSLGPVLVVDDNQINLQLMVTFVRKIRHAYESAIDGHQAVEAYKRSATDPTTGQPSGSVSKRFKYILMDINMPRKDGTAATKEIRQWERENKIDPPVKIFALTGLGEPGGHDWVEEAGFDKFLSKPLRFKDLNTLLV